MRRAPGSSLGSWIVLGFGFFALRYWLRQHAQAELVREYEAGYRRKPEGQREIAAAMATAVGLLRDEDDW